MNARRSRLTGPLSSLIPHPSSLSSAAHLCVCIAVLLLWSAPAPTTRRDDAPAPNKLTSGQIDEALQRAATLALGGRDGTIVVMDAQTGRLRAVVNEQLAATEAFPPGSAVKPFTLLAALRAHLVDADTRLLCRKHYRRGATEFSCSHPVYKTLFDPAHALAHSCNYFFAHLGERLDAKQFDATLAPFGFGETSDANQKTNARVATVGAHIATANAHASSSNYPTTRGAHHLASNHARANHADVRDAELAPRLPHGSWQTETALGEGGALLVTPLQLVTAYAALANGGHLFAPQRAEASNFTPHERAHLNVTDDERALIVAGMRGAVSYGTAERARLDSLPSRVFGKTGTATEIGGFRTHGWFVGFASDARASNDQTAMGDQPATSDQSETNDQRATNDQPAPSEVRLAVLVFLKRSQGKDCAELSRPIFDEYARLSADDARAHEQTDALHQSSARDANVSVGVLTEDLTATRASEEHEPTSPNKETTRRGEPSVRDSSSAGDESNLRGGGEKTSRGDETNVRVRLARDGAIVSMSLRDYLFGVLAAEASTEDEYAAIKSLAVVSRTYALQKLGRHAADGFDFCTTTHCERYLRVTAANARPDFHAMLRRAVTETENEVLRDSRGHLANAYFSASCGGMTANVQTLWGEPAREPFERGVPDEYCAALPATRWTDVIPTRDLLNALRADPRSDVGAHLDSITVVKRDATGRAELVSVAGERTKLLRGWDFKIIVGRTLGWSVVKSSRFSVERAGDRFVFRGAGFGHGLGLCQAGAHVMARNGSSYLQILAHYFPGASVGQLSGARASVDERQTPRDERQTSNAETQTHWRADATAPLFRQLSLRRAISTRDFGSSIASRRAHPSTARATLSSEHFRINFPARESRPSVESVLRTLEEARADLAQRLDAASLAQPALPTLEINVSETTADFVAATGQPSWVAAATRGARIVLQPLAALTRRGTLKETLRHEYAHALIDALSRGRAPAWLAEGLAAHFAGEGARLAPYAPAKKISVEEIERGLGARARPAEMRALYAAAYAEVRALIRAEGEPRVWRRVAGE